MYSFALIGFGPMAQALTLNALEKGHTVHLWNRTFEKLQTFQSTCPSPRLHIHRDLTTLIQSLPSPRTLILLIQAGNGVDTLLQEIAPLISPDDILIDMGNSDPQDTIRRQYLFTSQHQDLISLGISGGIAGARTGAAYMISGDRKKIVNCIPLLSTLSLSPQIIPLGSSAEGHYVKMVHNGIEYAHMDLWRIVHHCAQSDHWNTILKEVSTKSYLLSALQRASEEHIHDIFPHIEHKGTTAWMVRESLEHHIALPMITNALTLRILSQSYTPPQKVDLLRETYSLPTWYYTFTFQWAIYEGLVLLHSALPHVSLLDVLTIWKTGCIISGDPLSELYNFIKTGKTLSELKVHLLTQCTPERREELQQLLHHLIVHQIPLGSLAGFWDSMQQDPQGAMLLTTLRDSFGYHGIPTNKGITHLSSLASFLTP